MVKDKTIAYLPADGQPFTRFEVTGPASIRIITTIDNRQYRIVTGYRGADRRADEQRRPRNERASVGPVGAGVALAQREPDHRPAADRSPARNLFTVKGVGCACCPA